MHKIKFQTAPTMFENKFHKPNIMSNFSTSNYSIPPFKFSMSKYKISVIDPTLWKDIPTNSKKMQESVTAFKNSVRKKLLNLKIR